MCKFIIIIKLKGKGYENEYTTATIQQREEEAADSVILCTSNSFHIRKCRVGQVNDPNIKDKGLVICDFRMKGCQSDISNKFFTV